jgi:hypothetical protein
MIDPESIEVGQCYLTRSGQVRRVRAFHEGAGAIRGQIQAAQTVLKLGVAPWYPRSGNLCGHDRAPCALRLDA